MFEVLVVILEVVVTKQSSSFEPFFQGCLFTFFTSHCLFFKDVGDVGQLFDIV